MTPQIALVFGILIIAATLFVTEWLRMDLVALLVLGALALAGLVTPSEALSGFSSPAVVTVWAMFILSGSLSQTGVANLVGRQVLRLAGEGELRLVVVVMLTASVMSALMNNVGVAALLLPVVMDIARRTGRPPSRLLMPLAFGSLLGGLNTLIGTPPNILLSAALRDAGLRPFGMFDYTPTGVVVTLAGVLFMATIGRHLLPARDPVRESARTDAEDLRQLYDLRERLFVLRMPPGSTLAGKTLAGSRLGSVLGLNVVAILRNGQTQLAPSPGSILHAGDRFLVQGRLDRLTELQGRRHLLIEQDGPNLEQLISGEIRLVEAQIAPASSLVGRTLSEVDFRQRYGATVLAIRRQTTFQHTDLQEAILQAGDSLLIHGLWPRLEPLQVTPDFDGFHFLTADQARELYGLDRHLLALQIPDDSILAGRSLAESHLSDAFGLTALCLMRDGVPSAIPDPSEPLLAGDTLLVQGEPEGLASLRGLRQLELDRESSPDLRTLESERIGLAEAVLSPHTTLAGRSLRDIQFRDRYGLSVLAIWRGGQAYHANLRDMPLRFGDALLLYGARDKMQLLGADRDFLVLTEAAQPPPRLGKALPAVLVMAGILIPVILGWLPIAIAAVVGAALMVLTGCLNMEEAYRQIEWKAVFLIAGMLPLGIAMEQTGAAQFLAEGIVGTLGALGTRAVLAGLFLLATLASQVMPNPAVAVLLAPIALRTAANLHLSPYALMMVVAISSSAAFLSPVAHPANVLIMGPGGYRFTDYLKVGIPLTLVILAIVLLVLPIFWPLAA